MIRHILVDFSRVLLFPKNQKYSGALNDLYKEIIKIGSYKFFDYFRLNEELIQYLDTLKGKYTFSIFTTDIIQNDPALREFLEKYFSFVFVAMELGISKKDAKAYTLIAEKLGCLPSEVIFIDDNKFNVDAAKKAGLNVIQFVSNKQLVVDLSQKIFMEFGSG